MLYVFITTIANRASANRLARLLVEKKYAACVSIVPDIESHYSWKGRLEHSKEVLLIGKTTKSSFRRLKKDLGQLHPYEVPELIGWPMKDGLEAYFGWIRQSLQPARKKKKTRVS